jgi:hypothetical protein
MVRNRDLRCADNCLFKSLKPLILYACARHSSTEFQYKMGLCHSQTMVGTACPGRHSGTRDGDCAALVLSVGMRSTRVPFQFPSSVLRPPASALRSLLLSCCLVVLQSCGLSLVGTARCAALAFSVGMRSTRVPFQFPSSVLRPPASALRSLLLSLGLVVSLSRSLVVFLW